MLADNYYQVVFSLGHFLGSTLVYTVPTETFSLMATFLIVSHAFRRLGIAELFLKGISWFGTVHTEI